MSDSTTIRTLATHEVVRSVYPREVTDRDEVGMASGSAIDGAVSRFNFETARGNRPTVTSIVRSAEAALDRELADAHATMPGPERARFPEVVREMLRLVRRSEVFGLSRPRSRLLLIDGVAGIYAQPDFWNGRDVIYELKSYRAYPPRPDVQLQLELFQLAFPGFEERIVSMDRHAEPATLEIHPIPPVSDSRAREVLIAAREAAASLGQEKVLEYIDAPIVRRSIPP
ncbi:MAG TPA: hypothetical protein VEY07_03640 [Thermoplasmata archaeon]|nr:hypothetical protein [Thermoplasmata archaeon]